MPLDNLLVDRGFKQDNRPTSDFIYSGQLAPGRFSGSKLLQRTRQKGALETPERKLGVGVICERCWPGARPQGRRLLESLCLQALARFSLKPPQRSRAAWNTQQSWVPCYPNDEINLKISHRSFVSCGLTTGRSSHDELHLNPVVFTSLCTPAAGCSFALRKGWQLRRRWSNLWQCTTTANDFTKSTEWQWQSFPLTAII